MYTHANMICKDPKIEPEVCQIVAIRELSVSQFEHFRTHLLEDQDFISEVSGELYSADHDGTRCLLVLGEGYPYGILVNSEGSDYARYSGIMPHAREMVNNHLKALANYCVNEGTANAENGTWTITYEELYNHFGTEITLDYSKGWIEMLLAKLEARDEIDEIIAAEDEFQIRYHLEYCNKCQQGGIEGAMSLLSLIGCNLLDVHLQNDEGDGTKCFIPELDPSTLSEDGNREFADVLSARILMMRDDTITIQGVASDRIKRFSDVLNQNCTMEDYYKFVAPKSGEVRTPYHTVTQDEIDIASAKHTLWRLDQPEGVQANFSHCDLYGLDLSRKDFNGAIFADCRMRKCNAHNAEFCSATFCKSIIDNCRLESAYIENADFSDAIVSNSTFNHTELSGSNMKDSIWDNVSVDDARMHYCNFTDANFHTTHIEEADTTGCVYTDEDWDSDCCMVIRR